MSLKKNFAYSSILTVSTYLFPLLVYPYVSRTLGLTNIGIVNFVDNLINYFVFLSMMGIMTVGIREIAAARDDKTKLSKTFMSLLTLTAITTLLSIVILWIAMYTVPTLAPYTDLLYIGMVKLVFNLFLVEWFFTGMEEFKFITRRSIIIKCLYVACVFIFVKDASDYKTYFVLSAVMVAANATVNIFYSKRFIDYSIKSVDFHPFLKPFLIMGIYMLLTNVYTYLNPVWLGFVTDTDEVGYFTTATKLHTIIMAVLLSFTNILFPRVSHLLAEGKEQEFWEKISTSFDAIFLFSFPTIVIILSVGPDLLHLIVGDGFEGSYLPLRIISPLVLIIGTEQILIIQILLSMHQDTTVLRNSFIGAMVATILNLLITSHLGAPGSSIVWVVAEFVIMCLSAGSVFKKYSYVMPYKRGALYCISYTPLLLILLGLYSVFGSSLATLAVSSALVIVYAVLVETYILKNMVINILFNTIRSYINKSRQ